VSEFGSENADGYEQTRPQASKLPLGLCPRGGTWAVTNKSNRPILNQLLFTVARDLDTTATSWEYGFKLQLMYGSDARITHSIGLFDQAIHDRNQFDVVEANGSVRIPVIEGGVDLKVGIYPTPLGVETIDPKGNPFYSKSYIFVTAQVSQRGQAIRRSSIKRSG